MDTSTNTNVTERNDEEVCEEDNVDASIGEAGNGCRKSKRQKVPTKSLMGDFECDKGFRTVLERLLLMPSTGEAMLITRPSLLL